ncbi:hypothetical protein TUM19329_20900 [Legionella antarctica]|uniref:Uncharacterized protein n=2 Tax=Legionella antarctica TaxID=2708020 RepID=A0A6F8T5K2_9GAMM|nr:hypothetical protein TUM19329_20900 [Legionella antarctica]
MFFVPKILQQKFHVGVNGRVKLSDRYKNLLYYHINIKGREVERRASIKLGQSLYALDLVPNFTSKDELYKKISTDNSDNGKALREFIVEFENINQYIFRKIDDENIKKAMDKFRVAVYEQLHSFPIEAATLSQKQEFHNHILNSLKRVKEEIPSKYYSELKKHMGTFLKENVIFHPGLSTYLDETQTYQTKPKNMKDSSKAIVAIRDATNADEIAELLYQMSESSREAASEIIISNLLPLITNANQLGTIIRFIPPLKIEAMLRKPGIISLLENMDDLNGVMSMMFTADQRKMVFNATKNFIKDMKPNFAQLGECIQYLSNDQIKALLKTISFSTIQSDSSEDMIRLFEKLSTNQFNKILPIVDKKIAEYLGKRIGYDDGKGLHDFLKTKASDADALKAFKTIFPDVSKIISTQKNYKSQLTSLTTEPSLDDNSELKI